jgi:hypothetical protein
VQARRDAARQERDQRRLVQQRGQMQHVLERDLHVRRRRVVAEQLVGQRATLLAVRVRRVRKRQQLLARQARADLVIAAPDQRGPHVRVERSGGEARQRAARVDHQIDLARGEELCRARVQVLEMQAHARSLLRELLHDRRAQQLDHVIGRADLKTAGGARGIERLAHLERGFDRAQDLADRALQLACQRRQLPGVAHALQQRVIEDLAKLRERSARCGLTQTEPAPGATHGAFVEQRFEHHQQVQVDAPQLREARVRNAVALSGGRVTLRGPGQRAVLGTIHAGQVSMRFAE